MQERASLTTLVNEWAQEHERLCQARDECERRVHIVAWNRYTDARG